MDDAFKQFFDKRLWFVFGGLAFFHVLAFAVQHTMFTVLVLAAVFVATFVVAFRRLDVGLAIAFLEIFTGGHGHLVEANIAGLAVSLRMVVFAAVMLAWALLLVRRRVHVTFVRGRDVSFALLAFAVVLGTIIGATHNAFGNVVDDMNGYATIAYLLPVASVMWTSERKRMLLQTFFISAAFVSASTLVLVFLFTHLPGLVSQHVYTFVRDARLAEVTLLTTPTFIASHLAGGAWYFRVFQQSQFIVAAFLLLLTSFLFSLPATVRVTFRTWAVFGLVATTVVASLSRSFWLGCVAGALVITGSLVFLRVPLRSILRRKIMGGMTIVIGLLTLWALVSLPFPPRPDITETSFYRANAQDDRGLAVSSRWNLLLPLHAAIAESPILGLGLGTEVTYTSDDPRLRAINPTGEYTTYRFEWGYEDILLKLGILGLVAFAAYVVSVFRVAFDMISSRRDTAWLAAGFAAGIALLFVTHITSPYLNHPIGLGFMLFVLPFFDWLTTRKAVPAHITLRNTLAAAIPDVYPSVPVTNSVKES